MLHARNDRLLQQQVIEEIEAERSNELLELRSQSIRGLIAARSRGWQPDRAGRPISAHGTDRRPPTAEQSMRNARSKQLESELRRIRSTYEYKGYSAEQPVDVAYQAPRRGPSEFHRERAHGRTLRGGWPVEQVVNPRLARPQSARANLIVGSGSLEA